MQDIDTKNTKVINLFAPDINPNVSSGAKIQLPPQPQQNQSNAEYNKDSEIVLNKVFIY